VRCFVGHSATKHSTLAPGYSRYGHSTAATPTICLSVGTSFMNMSPPHTIKSTGTLIPPATPIPSHPSDEALIAEGLSTAATAFALKAYLESFLHHLGWDPSATSASAFITQYSWLLGEELSTTPEKAAAIFYEIFERTTPSVGAVCHAVAGMEKKLHCSPETSRAVKRLFKNNHGVDPQWALKNWEDMKLDEKVGPELMKGRKIKVVGWWAVWRVLWRKVFTEKEKEKDETPAAKSVFFMRDSKEELQKRPSV